MGKSHVCSAWFQYSGTVSCAAKAHRSLCVSHRKGGSRRRLHAEALDRCLHGCSPGAASASFRCILAWRHTFHETFHVPILFRHLLQFW